MFYKFLFTALVVITSLNAMEDIKNLKSFKADFSQQITSSSGNIIDYTGVVFIKSDGKILWKYKTPIIKNVYVLNNYAIVDEPELEQAIYTQLENEINIIQLLNESQKINENSYIAKIDDIDYLIQTNKKQIENIKYKDKLDNSVVIVFNNVLQNKSIEDDLFNFTAPEYYDIIRK